MRKLLVGLALVMLAVAQTGAPQGRGGAAMSGEVPIGPEDTLTIVALNVDEISRAWRVSGSGDLSLPMIGRIRVAGMMVDQVQREIVSRLSRYVHDPQVTVFVSEYRNRPVTISGVVEKPGTVQLQGTTTLYAALVQAGGPKETATTVTLTRKLASGKIPDPRARVTPDSAYSVVELPLGEVMRGFGEAADLPVVPHDVITVVGEKRTRMVYISGEVARPGGIELVTQDVVSLTKAIALAGGLTRTAAPRKTLIRHISASGVETAMGFVNLKQVLSGHARDLLLSDGDVVIVPSSQLLGYLQTASTSAITAGVYVLGRL